jgi:putative ATPase
MKLFESEQGWRPLAERRRPRVLKDVVGQEIFFSPGNTLVKQLEKGLLSSLIFWGPPGVGKTTLGKILARESGRHFFFFSASMDGLKELRNIVGEAEKIREQEAEGSVLFCDEIHRLNKGQQDAFLPHVENGLITLIGATTENPSFEVNKALLSRCRVFVLAPLKDGDLLYILQKALNEDALLKTAGLKVDEVVLKWIVAQAEGDARKALNHLESLLPLAGQEISLEKVQSSFSKTFRYDKNGEEHYNLISALHKSLRASDVQASLYYCQRMLAGGEDRKYLLRRLMRVALEDVGLADPGALQQAAAVKEAVIFMGESEGDLALLQLVVYLASAPKSNALYEAEKKIKAEIEKTGSLPVPLALLNAPTALMKKLGYGKDYRYDHHFPHHYAGQSCLPENLEGSCFYRPGNFGFEKEIQKRLNWWEKLKKEAT